MCLYWYKIAVKHYMSDTKFHKWIRLTSDYNLRQLLITIFIFKLKVSYENVFLVILFMNPDMIIKYEQSIFRLKFLFTFFLFLKWSRCYDDDDLLSCLWYAINKVVGRLKVYCYWEVNLNQCIKRSNIENHNLMNSRPLYHHP